MKDPIARTVILFILLINTFTMVLSAVNGTVPLPIALGIGVSNMCAAGLIVTLKLENR